MTASVLGVMVAAGLVLGGSIVEGVVVAALSGYWLIGRARVPEELGARFLGRKATLELMKALLLGLILLATIATVFVGVVLHWNREPEGNLLFLALIGVMVLLQGDLSRRIEHIEHLRVGGDAERAVSDALHDLPGNWVVEDNHLRADGYGNVDHIVRRPDGEVFAVETKSGKFRSRQLGQAVSAAVAIKQERGLRWVTPVLCVDDPSRRADVHVIGSARVWVVDRRDLGAWFPAAPPTRGFGR